MSLQALANLIFSSGLTTRTQVSDISGRGVGMDAVKQFINDGGGDIRVQFPSNTPEMFEEGMEHQAFSLVINLPKQHYFVSADCSVSHSVSA